MTDKQACNKGYKFTGYYSNNNEGQKAQATKMRKDFSCHACVVFIPTSPLSKSRNSSSGGYGIYADMTYFKKCHLKQIQLALSSFPNHIKVLKETYEKDLLVLQNQQKVCLQKEQDLIKELS